MCHSAFAEVRQQVTGVDFSPPVLWIPGPNSSYQDWLQVPLLAELSHWPSSLVLLLFMLGFSVLEIEVKQII